MHEDGDDIHTEQHARDSPRRDPDMSKTRVLPHYGADSALPKENVSGDLRPEDTLETSE